jgi:hypothetical protein
MEIKRLFDVPSVQNASRPYRALACTVLPAKMPELARREVPPIDGQHEFSSLHLEA